MNDNPLLKHESFSKKFFVFSDEFYTLIFNKKPINKEVAG